MSVLTNNEIQRYAREAIQAELNKAWETIVCWKMDPSFESEREFELATLQSGIETLRRRVTTGSLGELRAEAKGHLRARLPSRLDIDLETVDATAELLARGRMDIQRWMISHLDGDFEKAELLDPAFKGMQPTELPNLEGQQYKFQLTLSDVMKAFVEQKGKGWVGKTAADYDRTFNWAKEIIGPNRLIKDLDTEDVRAFRDLLGRVPSNMVKFPEFQKLTLTQVISRSRGHDKLSEKTQSKYFGMFKSFLKWAHDEEYMPVQPGKAVQVAPQAKANRQTIRSFDEDELINLLKSPLYQGCESVARRSSPGPRVIEDAKYWVPLVALLSGMRLGEIIQLHHADIKEKRGILYFDVNERGEKKLKTGSSIRQVPVSKVLIGLGFDDFRKARLKNRDDRLFHEIDRGAGGYYSHSFSKWWTYYTRSIKAYKKGETDFHSFRHTFRDGLIEADVPTVISMALMGHKENTVHAGYGSGPSIEKLSGAVDKLTFGIDLVSIIRSGRVSRTTG